jgi:hypothetical protein
MDTTFVTAGARSKGGYFGFSPTRYTFGPWKVQLKGCPYLSISHLNSSLGKKT